MRATLALNGLRELINLYPPPPEILLLKIITIIILY